jgi:hypothetical protein
MPPDAPAGWTDPTDDPALERRFRMLSLPVALLLAFLVIESSLRFVARTFLTMWVHELGHAVTAWLCGFGAFPGPWLTPVSRGRLPLLALVLAALLVYGTARAWKSGQRAAAAGLVALLAVQAIGTLGLRTRTAQAVILFGGDGGLFVLGAALMATFYVPRGSALHRTWLRWGFLVIGAFAFADGFVTWWDAKHTAEGVVFGENVGVGDSDATRLVFTFGWSEAQLVARYLRLAWTVWAFLLGLYLFGVRPLRGSATSRRPWPGGGPPGTS